MSNPLDEALAAMDQHLETEEAPSPTEETPSTEERPRDEQGRFTSTEAEEETAETEEETPAEQAERLLAGKYKSPEDLERAYKELESRLGSQGAELAEYRRAIEQAQEQPQQPAPIDQPTAQWFEQQVDTNPYGAAVWALQRQDAVLYNQAMDAWYDLEPRQAAHFERQLELQQVKQEFDQRLAQTTQPLAEQEMARAFKAATDRHPDVKDNLAQLLESAAQNAPVVTQTLMAKAQEGDLATKIQVFDAIISLAKGQNTTAVTQAVQGAADEEAAAARQLKQSGGVATQSTAVQAETVDDTEQWLRDNFDKHLSASE